MPLYDFVCKECGSFYEVMIPVSKLNEVVDCPNCGKKLERKFPAPRGIVIN